MASLILTAVVVFSSIAAAPSRSDWQADYGKALAATRSDDRPLLVVLDVPSDPDSAIESKQLAPTGEQSNLLDSYQRCHVDVSTEYGQKVAKAFGAKKFPFTAIIDKTGSVVLCKKMGQLSDEQWRETLAKYQSGERQTLSHHTSFYRGDGVVYEGNSVSSGLFNSASPTIVNPSYCPSCQLQDQ